MPVTKLIVEGELDSQVLFGILNGRPVVVAGLCSKQSLAPRTRDERKHLGGPTVVYLRDRDFDYDPPTDVSEPTIDKREGAGVLGWRWCRHEIENYLIDPVLVRSAMDWESETYAKDLVDAAKRIRHYQIARWVIGSARRSVPPAYDLRTRPGDLYRRDIGLPEDLSERWCIEWAQTQLSQFLGQLTTSLGREAVEESIKSWTAQIDGALATPDGVLLVYSGKDVLASLAPQLSARGIESPGVFRNRMRDWVQANPDRAVALFPEWRRLVELLRG
jgi:hypothetical protein